MQKKIFICLMMITGSISSNAQTWNLSGNSGTTSSDFIGTTDNLPLIFRTNNQERARFTIDGNFLLGTTTNAGFRFDVSGGIRSSLDAQFNGILVGKGPGTATNTVAVGNNVLTNNTTGYRNVAVGTNTLRYNTTGYNNVAIGAEALGSDASATGISSSVAVGTLAKISGDDAVAIGSGAFSGLFSIALGMGSSATGQGTMAIGRYSEASGGIGLAAIGWNSKALHTGGLIFGYNLQTTANYQLLLGNKLTGAGIRDVYIGGGVTQQLASTYGPLTIQPTGQLGTDQTGQTIRIATGKGTGTGTSGDILLMTSVPGASGDVLQSLTTSMIIKGATGNVGIGTSTPAAQLHTTGSMRFAGLTANNALDRVLVSDATGNISYRDASSLGSGGGISGTINYLAKYASSSSIANSLVFDDGTAVGIGTVNIGPGYKLFVETGIRTRKIKVDMNNWPDYVFSKTYKLQPLSELEAYIQTHQHLPEVPSAEEVEKEGLNLGDNQAVLLKKVEELTLHLLEMNKRVEQLESQNKILAETIKSIQQ